MAAKWGRLEWRPCLFSARFPPDFNKVTARPAPARRIRDAPAWFSHSCKRLIFYGWPAARRPPRERRRFPPDFNTSPRWRHAGARARPTPARRRPLRYAAAAASWSPDRVRAPPETWTRIRRTWNRRALQSPLHPRRPIECGFRIPGNPRNALHALSCAYAPACRGCAGGT